jgi:hypothetical protein
MLRSAEHGKNLSDLREAGIAGQPGQFLTSPNAPKLEAKPPDGTGGGERAARTRDGMCRVPQGGQGHKEGPELS